MSESVIRNARPDDVPALTGIYNHFVTATHITFDVNPCSEENRRAWFDQFHESGPHRILAAESDGVLAGYACSTPLRPKAAYEVSVETTIYLDPAFTGQGVGRTLYAALFAALETEDVHRAYGCIALPNPESVALHERLGFDHVGTFHQAGRKFDRYWDIAWYEKKMRQ
jgi:phosphinothricin acetyltransferase